MARVSKPKRICVILSVVVLLILSMACSISLIKFDDLFALLIGQKLAILPGSEVFENWKSPSVPIYFSIYLYNLTNPNSMFLQGAKPHFQEVGPYVYREDRQRFNISFSNESTPRTINYSHRIYYHFEREMSVGPDTEGLVYTLDLPTAALSANSLSFFFWLAFSLSDFQPFSKGTPHDLIWGYEHNFLKKCKNLGFCPTTQSGLMAGKNGSAVHDYTVATGAYNSQNKGKVLTFNGKTKLNYWGSEPANMINGTDGSIAPPGLKIGSRINFFVGDFCRSFYSVAVKWVNATNNENIPLLAFSSPREQALNATLNPLNQAFCPKKKSGPACPPTGFIPLSPCSDVSYPPPVFASQPHFLGTDPEVLEALDGIQQPNASRDSTVIYIEPNTGFVLEAYKRMQINMYLVTNSDFKSIYGNATGDIFIPLAWFTEIAVADKKSLVRIESMVLRPKGILKIIITVISFLASVLSLVVIVVLIIYSRMQRHPITHSKRVPVSMDKDQQPFDDYKENKYTRRDD